MYALLDKNQIKVGPRAWYTPFFARYLNDQGVVGYNLPTEYSGEDPIVINDDIKILRVFDGEASSYNAKIEQPAGPFLEIMEDKVIATWSKADKYIDAVKGELKAQINEERVKLEQLGFLYQFPDSPGIIQTRNEVDIRNVQSVTTTALILSANGVVDPVIAFRDQADITHNLTPSDAISMGMAVQTYIGGIYQWSWDKKTEIDACTTLIELDAVQLTRE